MYKDESGLFEELKDILAQIRDNQLEILKQLDEIKVDQKLLHEEIKLSYSVLNQNYTRNEILN